MNIQRRVRQYESGAITNHQLILEALSQIEDESVDLVLRSIPAPLYQELKEYLDHYEPGQMRSNYGPIPSPESVRQARHWLNSQMVKTNCP